MTITTEFVYPPIPIRSFDWRCFDSDSEDSPIGWGPTEALAIADFESQLAELDCAHEDFDDTLSGKRCRQCGVEVTSE